MPSAFPHRARLFARATLIVCFGFLLTACNPGSGSRPVSMNIWQTQMESYVKDQANGDINALRDVEIATGQPGFRAFSNDRPEQSKDITGALVGVHASGIVIWYVYLVGDLDRESVTNLHLAAVNMAGDQFRWRVGNDAGNGTAAYRAHREKLWREHHGPDDPPRAAFSFPSAGDRFTLQTAGDVLTVRELESGAQWTLSVATTESVQR